MNNCAHNGPFHVQFCGFRGMCKGESNYVYEQKTLFSGVISRGVRCKQEIRKGNCGELQPFSWYVLQKQAGYDH